MRTALIFGVSGQDGAYLARLLLGRQYAVHGTSRDATQPFARLHALGIRSRVATHTASMNDRDELRRLLAAIRPDEIYNLAGLTSVALSFHDPATAHASTAGAQMLLLDAVRSVVPTAKVYHSASSDCFGDMPHGSAGDERTPFAPRSPYAAGKAAAHEATIDARERHGLHAVSGIVFNHESPLRGEHFVTKKIVAAAAAGASVTLGDLSASRDWGYAAESVEAMWLMLQQKDPEDLVIATGESHSVEELAAAAFAAFGLDHREHVIVDPALFRPSDIRYSRGNPARALTRLGWQAATRFEELVTLMAAEERQTPASAARSHVRAASRNSRASRRTTRPRFR